jgi:predicted nuclease of predicted toxin-antitoxin system
VRFLLDQDVAGDVAQVIRRVGGNCHLASDVGLAEAADEELAVYAAELDMVLVTHDRRFAQRKLLNSTGQLIWLRCPEDSAAEILHSQLIEVISILSRHARVLVVVGRAGVTSRSG